MSTTDPTASTTTEVEPRFEIKSRSGRVLYVARAANLRDAVAEAVAAKSDLSGSDLSGSNLPISRLYAMRAADWDRR